MNADVSPDLLDSERAPEEETPRPVPNWAELPAIAVEKIYSFLNRKDQCRMSMVCRNWYGEYGSAPALWRQVTFYIRKGDLNAEVYPEVMFARKYGSMFRRVDIDWLPLHAGHPLHSVVPRRPIRELYWKQIKLFLEALANHAQVETVTFIPMFEDCYRLRDCYRLEDCYRRDDPDYVHDDDAISEVRRALKNFFSSQHRLKTVEWCFLEVSKRETAEILRILLNHSNESLQNIRLQYFASDEEPPPESEYEAVNFESFLNVQTLELPYTTFFEDAMRTFYEHAAPNSDSSRIRKGNLERIEIDCHGFAEVRYRGIPDEAWRLLTEMCPSLRICLTYVIGKWNDRYGIDFFVVRHMPLKVLEVIKCRYRHSNSVPEIEVIFGVLLLRRANECLEDLRLRWLQNNDNLANDVIRFLPTCEKLRIFRLDVEHPIEYLDTLFSWCLENRHPSLRDVSVTVRNVRSVGDAATYSSVADHYAPLLKKHGVDLKLIVNDS